MSDVEVIHEHADGYTETGHSVSYTDGYIKFRKTFRYKAMRLLKGAPLSVFLDVALATEPIGILTICADTGYGSHSVCNALDFLVLHNFLEELGRSGSNGSKQYRAKSYTWSGSDRNAPPDSDLTPVSSGGRIALDAIRQKRDTVPDNAIEPPKSAIRRARNAIPVHDDGTFSLTRDKTLIEENASSCQEREAMLSGAGFEGVNVHRLAEKVTDIAIIKEWCKFVTENPRKYRRPQGEAYLILKDDPRALPKWPQKKERKREYHTQGLMIEKVRAAREKEQSA